MPYPIIRAIITPFIGLVLYHRFFSVVDCYMQPRFHFPFRKLIVAALVSVACALRTFLPVRLNFPVSILIYLSALVIFYKGSPYTKALCFSLHFGVLMFAEFSVVIIISMFGWTYSVENLSALLLDILSALVYIIFSFNFEKLKFIIDDHLDKHLQLGLIGTSFSLFLIYCCMYLNGAAELLSPQFTAYGIIMKSANAVGMFLPLFSLLSLFSLIHQCNISNREAEVSRLMISKAQMELEYYQSMLTKNREYQKLRHDLKNHLLAIDALGSANSFDRQHAYIANLGEAFSQTEMSISCGHLLIDSIFQAKASKMERAGIHVTWQLSPLPEVIAISDLDLCVLLGNLLDNAIESCERITDTQARSISIKLQTSGEHLSLQITNSADQPNELIQSMHASSQKRRNHHGYGLINIQSVVDRYLGVMDIQPTANMSAITIRIVLPVLK